MFNTDRWLGCQVGDREAGFSIAASDQIPDVVRLRFLTLADGCGRYEALALVRLGSGLRKCGLGALMTESDSNNVGIRMAGPHRIQNRLNQKGQPSTLTSKAEWVRVCRGHSVVRNGNRATFLCAFLTVHVVQSADISVQEVERDRRQPGSLQTRETWHRNNQGLTCWDMVTAGMIQGKYNGGDERVYARN